MKIFCSLILIEKVLSVFIQYHNTLFEGVEELVIAAAKYVCLDKQKAGIVSQ